MTRGAFIVVGLGYGDEGKGTVVDFLARRHDAALVVRWNGGPQAAHRVVQKNGTAHVFSQVGSGTFVPGVRTHLAAPMAVDPLALVREEKALRDAGVLDAFARLSVDPYCVVVTPFHRALNRIEESLRAGGRHGSCGLGVGEALLDSERAGLPVLRAGDTLDRDAATRTLRILRRVKLDRAEQSLATAGSAATFDPTIARELSVLGNPALADELAFAYHHVFTECVPRLSSLAGALRAGGDRNDSDASDDKTVIFEGAQGVLLDRDHGFWPHLTPSRTTPGAALELLAAAGYDGPVVRIGVLRAYATRHGAGPLVTEDSALTASLPDVANRSDAWQGPFRCGWFDTVTARYAISACGGVDEIALTNLDRLSGRNTVRIANAYAISENTESVERRPAGFSSDGKSQTMRDLAIEKNASIDRRAALTQLLGRSHPVYSELEGWDTAGGSGAARYLDYLESKEALAAPITLVSVGPTAGDKVERDGSGWHSHSGGFGIEARGQHREKREKEEERS